MSKEGKKNRRVKDPIHQLLVETRCWLEESRDEYKDALLFRGRKARQISGEIEERARRIHSKTNESGVYDDLKTDIYVAVGLMKKVADSPRLYEGKSNQDYRKMMNQLGHAIDKMEGNWVPNKELPADIVERVK